MSTSDSSPPLLRKQGNRDFKKTRNLKGEGGDRKSDKQPIIYDTDYGPFIDDVFALGLLANSDDLVDLRYVLTTGENPTLGAQCAAKHLFLAEKYDIPVGIGAEFPDYIHRGGVCAIPGLVGFALEEKCSDGPTLPVDEDGIASVASMIMDSERDDWWYLVVGGLSSVQALVENYPDAASKISTLVIMGGNWCANFQPYPDVDAPTDETNIACDPSAANFVIDSTVSPFENVYFVPVAVADEIGGDDYMKIVQAANDESDLGAKATIDFYKAWSAAGRADPTLLIHLEAMAYDPETESTPMFDPCAVMLVLELLDDCEDRLSLFEFNAGVHFLEADDDGLKPFPEAPRSAFSLLPISHGVMADELPAECPALTEFTFDPAKTPENDKPVTIALGFTSQAAKDSFYGEMAERMAGTYPKNKTGKVKSGKKAKCYKKKSKKSKSNKSSKDD
jgi:inosine-uridine nucleoside N-ribohydrolase